MTPHEAIPRETVPREAISPDGLHAFLANPLFGVGLTLLAYVLAQALHRRWRAVPPLLLTCGGLIALLLLGNIHYRDEYDVGGKLISFFLGPATIALGLPLYRQWPRIRGHAAALLLAVTGGAAAGLASAFFLVRACGGSARVLRSMLPKSVTTPISMEVSRQLGGDPELTAVFTVLAGLVGSVIGPPLLRLVGVRHDLAVGLAMGTSSHGIGTARVLRDSELQGGVSGLAMALAGILTSLLAIPVARWLKAAGP